MTNDRSQSTFRNKIDDDNKTSLFHGHSSETRDEERKLESTKHIHAKIVRCLPRLISLIVGVLCVRVEDGDYGPEAGISG